MAPLWVALPEMSPGELAELPIGSRDTLLLRLRALTLGPTLNGQARCPQCSTSAEFALDVHDFADFDADATGAPPNQEYLLEEGGASVRFRLPTPADLTEAAASPSIDAAKSVLLGRCSDLKQAADAAPDPGNGPGAGGSRSPAGERRGCAAG